jgi:hypothetical protein
MKKVTSRKATPVKLLAGGNPQIAKADGDAPVQAYLAAMPGWKQDVGRRLERGRDADGAAGGGAGSTGMGVGAGRAARSAS